MKRQEIARHLHNLLYPPGNISGAPAEALRAAVKLCTEPCVTRASDTCMYLNDDTKVVVCRDALAQGRAWLEVRSQLCFSCAQPVTLSRVDGLCETCHATAVAESDGK